jgi:putative RecB family exonuclease
MELTELRQKPHLSASSINDYLDCGLLYKLGRVLKLQPEIRPDALEFGSIIHKVLAEFYKHKLEGEIVPLLDLQILFEAWWKKATENGPEITYKDGKNAEILLQDGKNLLSAYYQKLPRDNFQVIAIEEPFQFTLANFPIPRTGKPPAMPTLQMKWISIFSLLFTTLRPEQMVTEIGKFFCDFIASSKPSPPSSKNISPQGPRSMKSGRQRRSGMSGKAFQKGCSSPMRAGNARAAHTRTPAMSGLERRKRIYDH